MIETNLFIIWEKARDMSEKIIDDMKKEFNILKIFEVEWDKYRFSENLTRFYGTNLPKNSHKEKHCGNGAFYLIVLDDNKCKYANRNTSKGVQYVNTHMFDLKQKYRDWTGGGHKIHGTNSEKETNHDLTLLLGKNIKDFKQDLKLNPWDGKIVKLKTNIIGYDGWDDIRQVFYVLNNGANYAVLRNYESLFSSIYQDGHEDIDLLCKDKKEVEYLLNCKPKFKQKYRVHYSMKVNNKDVMVDLRHIGDGYYDELWQKDMLDRRVYNNDGFYNLCLEDYYYSLIYHAIIQKNMFAYDYEYRLQYMAKKLNKGMIVGENEFLEDLNLFMKKNGYKYTIPNDYSVLFRFNKVEEVLNMSRITKIRRLIKFKKINIYYRLINEIYKLSKFKWIIIDMNKFNKRLQEKDIIDIKKFQFDRWVRKGKSFIGKKDGKKVFIKVSDKYFSALSEINALKKLNNENNDDGKYFTYVDYSEKSSDSYIVYNYQDVKTLKYYIDRGYLFNDYELLFLIKFFNELLDELYNNKIIHRDIRPENIMMILDKDRVKGFKIFDFGYAVIDNKDYLNIEKKYDKYTLLCLGTEFKYSPLRWDDAASAKRIIEYVDKLASIKYPEEIKKIEDKIGRYYIKY